MCLIIYDNEKRDVCCLKYTFTNECKVGIANLVDPRDIRNAKEDNGHWS